MHKHIPTPITLTTTLSIAMGIASCDQPMLDSSVNNERMAQFESLTPDQQQQVDQLVNSLLDDQLDPSGLEKLTNGSNPNFSTGWSAWTTDGLPPVSCDVGYAISGFQCSGGHCDNMRIYCSLMNSGSSSVGWTSYFSEENSPSSSGDCGWFVQKWMTGLACKGDECDDMSVQCTMFPYLSAGHTCITTNYFSEEGGGTMMLPAGYFAKEMWANGSRSDKLRVYACKP